MPIINKNLREYPKIGKKPDFTLNAFYKRINCNYPIIDMCYTRLPFNRLRQTGVTLLHVNHPFFLKEAWEKLGELKTESYSSAVLKLKVYFYHYRNFFLSKN